MHQVAITGIGIVSCLGIGTDAVAKALHAGKSGIVFDAEREALGFQSPLTARIDGFDPKAILGRKQRKTMTLHAQHAYAAALQCIEQSGLAPEDLQNERTGLVFGCDSSALPSVEQVELLKERGETRLIGSGHVFQAMTSNVTMNLNTLLGTKGANWSISGACASGGHAIGQAADLISLGRQERIICGGAQEINWQSMCSFDALGAFSMQTDDPTKACKPFDRNRDGLVPGGGAAALLLERLDIAQARGASILGIVAGYGFSSDGENISVPSDEGLSRAMRMAMTGAGVYGSDIDYICAHATSTPSGDAAEARNIYKVFGDACPPISSLKSMTGHELWMSGAAQAVYSTIMAANDFIAPNINFAQPDEDSRKLDILTETRETRLGTVLCNSAGFGGTNASLVLTFPA